MLHSDEHPDLRGVGYPKTKQCVRTYQRKYHITTSQEVKKKSELHTPSNHDVSQFVVENNINNDIELFVKTKE